MVETMKISKEISAAGRSVARAVEEAMFKNDDPDPNYVLTMDNAKKILAIHQRLRYVCVHFRLATVTP